MNAQLLTTTLLKQVKWVQTEHRAVQLTRNNLSGCKTQLQFCIKNSQSHSLVSSPGKQTYRCLGFWPFTIAQFNTTLWISVTGSNKLGWDRVAAQQSASHSPTNKQITLSSVKLCLHILWHKTVLQSHNTFCASKTCLSFMEINTFNVFDAFWGALIVLWLIFVTSWNQTGI
jgi:hypothetical protein